jgi:Transglycosylase-like domain/LysM domain
MRESLATTTLTRTIGTVLASAVILTVSASIAVASPQEPSQEPFNRPVAGFYVSARAHAAVPDWAVVTPPVTSAPTVTYVVVTGDTLTHIAVNRFGDALAWHAVWQVNQATVPDPNLIFPGQALTLPTVVQDAADVVPTLPPPPHASPQPIHHPRVAPVTRVPATVTHVNVGGYGGFEACVVRRESGGNPQVMNRTGHYGLFQFSFSTWVRNGGSPGSFGHASVAEQDQVFANTMAKPGGANNWAPYDGC